MTLTGLFFYKECGEHYRTGEIFRQVHSDAYLVLLDKVIPDLTAWVTWLETPSEKKPSVVNLVKG